MPAGWVVPLPGGLTTRQAMALGTAGFTAALSVARLEEAGLTPGSGPVIVTGASGGVGSTAVDILAARGYEVAASTGSADAHEYLRSLGAREILDRAETSAEQLPPDGARAAGPGRSMRSAAPRWHTCCGRRTTAAASPSAATPAASRSPRPCSRSSCEPSTSWGSTRWRCRSSGGSRSGIGWRPTCARPTWTRRLHTRSRWSEAPDGLDRRSSGARSRVGRWCGSRRSSTRC